MADKSKQKTRQWKSTDVATLRKLYADSPTNKIARRLRKPISAVYAKANSLGLSKSKAFLSGPHSGRIKPGQILFGEPWTRAQVAKLRKLWPDHTGAALVKELGHPLTGIYGKATQLGLKKSAAFLASEKSGRLDGVRGAATRFKKGQSSWMKGKRGIRMSVATEFQKGITPHNHVPVGTIVMATIGYLKVKVAEPKEWRWVHRLIWEEFNGPVPDGMMVVFRDGNHENVEPSNLHLITRQEHMARHTIANYPPSLRESVHLLSKLNRKIEEQREKQDSGPA